MARKSKRALCSDVEDRLSSLPDDLLIRNVLPLLPMRESVRTSILNRRWRTLWRRVPRMDFHPSSAKAVCIPTRQPETFFSQEGGAVSKFVEWGDRVMGAYEGGSATLRQFSVVFPLDKMSSSRTGSWLEFALAKEVEVLELDFCQDFCYDPDFPLIPPHLLPNLRALRSLTLGGVSIANASLDHLLRGCESLERLKLHSFSSLTEVNITGPVSRLKSIEILCHRYEFKSIKILAPTPDLVSLTLPGRSRPTLHIEHAPRLVDLTLGPRDRKSGFDPVLHPLFGYLSQLETLDLRINFWNQEEFKWLPHLRNLNRLKHLKLALSFQGDGFTEIALKGLASVIEAASSVRHLTLDVCYAPEKLEISKAFRKLQPQNLRVIEIVGFRGLKEGIFTVCELALQLIKGAVSLEKLIIDHRDTSQCKLSNEYGPSKGTIQRWKTYAKALIEPELPSTVDLLVV